MDASSTISDMFAWEVPSGCYPDVAGVPSLLLIRLRIGGGGQITAAPPETIVRR